MGNFKIQYYDPTFDEYLDLETISQLGPTAKLKPVPLEGSLKALFEVAEALRDLTQKSESQQGTIQELQSKLDQMTQDYVAAQETISRLEIDRERSRIRTQNLSNSLQLTRQIVAKYEKEDIFKQGAQLNSWNPFSQHDIQEELWNRVDEKLFSKCILPQQHDLTKIVQSSFHERVPEGPKPTRIEFVRNFCLQKKFESTLIIMSKQGHEELNSPLAARFPKSAEKDAVLKRFSKRYLRVSENTKIKVVLTWVGISPSRVETVCNTGFVDLRQTDKGYFGAGIYSTLQASYAMQYAEGRYCGASPVPANADGEHCLVLCWVAVGNVYPISRDTDYDSSTGFSRFFHRDIGLALQPGFDSHCACVLLDERKWFQAAKFNHDDEVFNQDPATLVDEIVVKESSQILPFCIVYYKAENKSA